MYQGGQSPLLCHMSTLHRFAEAAVRRDLHRARVLLASGTRLSVDRRRALAGHLAWMARLVSTPDAAVTEAAAALFAAACAFRDDGERGRRVDLLGAIGAFHRVSGSREHWTSPEALRGIGQHVPWLLDGVATPPGAGLVLRESGGREQGRIRAAAYRRTKAHLWGTVSLGAAADEDATQVTGS